MTNVSAVTSSAAHARAIAVATARAAAAGLTARIEEPEPERVAPNAPAVRAAAVTASYPRTSERRCGACSTSSSAAASSRASARARPATSAAAFAAAAAPARQRSGAGRRSGRAQPTPDRNLGRGADHTATRHFAIGAAARGREAREQRVAIGRHGDGLERTTALDPHRRPPPAPGRPLEPDRRAEPAVDRNPDAIESRPDVGGRAGYL